MSSSIQLFQPDEVPDDFPGMVPWDNEFDGAATVQTMSSVEIAKLCNKRHDHVMRDIQVTLAQVGVDLPKFGGIYLDDKNRQYRCYFLPKRECLILVSGYSVPLRTAIIDRWQELEAKLLTASEPQIPRSYAEALMAAAQLALKSEEQERLLAVKDQVIEEKEQLLEEQQPAVEFVENYVESSKLFGIRETAKLLKVAQNTFVDLCLKYKVLFRQGGSGRLHPYAEWLTKGYLRVVTSLDDQERAFDQTKFTTRGRTWIVQYLNRKISQQQS
jgi:phage antirepressor YoqD-like protein